LVSVFLQLAVAALSNYSLLPEILSIFNIYHQMFVCIFLSSHNHRDNAVDEMCFIWKNTGDTFYHILLDKKWA